MRDDGAVMQDQEDGLQELADQMDAAGAAIRAAVLRLLQEGEVHPRVVVMAAARVTGELAAAPRWPTARTSGRCWTGSPRWCARPDGTTTRRC